MKVPYLWAGKQYPHSGHGFAGIYVWGQSGYREYVLTELNETPSPNIEYEISINYALASNSPYACDWLGIRLLDEEGRTVQTILEFDVEQMDQNSGWVTASYQYMGMGSEHFIVIGNFNDSDDFEVVEVPRTYVHPMLERRSYYFIDDISFSRPFESPVIFSEVVENEPVDLDEVYFAFDKSNLIPSSYEQLDQLGLYIKENANSRFRITGHTDNIGNEEYNLSLSEARANTVLKYLMLKGVARSRLIAIGKGASEPVSTNETPRGREANRRVTFTILAH